MTLVPNYYGDFLFGISENFSVNNDAQLPYFTEPTNDTTNKWLLYNGFSINSLDLTWTITKKQ